jgi:hypothetical protein
MFYLGNMGRPFENGTRALARQSSYVLYIVNILGDDGAVAKFGEKLFMPF